MKAMVMVELELPSTPVGQNTFRLIAMAISKVCKQFPIEVVRIHLVIDPLVSKFLNDLKEDQDSTPTKRFGS